MEHITLQSNLEWMHESYISLESGNFSFHASWKEQKLSVVNFGGKTASQLSPHSQPSLVFNLKIFTPSSEYLQNFDKHASVENNLLNFENYVKNNVNEFAYGLVGNSMWSGKLNCSSSCSIFKGLNKIHENVLMTNQEWFTLPHVEYGGAYSIANLFSGRKLWLIAKTKRSGQQMKTLMKNIKDLKFYLENECTGVCKNWAWYYVQPGDVIIQPELAVHTVLTFNTGETEIHSDVKTQHSITMMLIIGKLDMFYSV